MKNTANQKEARREAEAKLLAKEKGYDYVIDESTNSLLVKPPGYDLMAAVKIRLGIK